MPLGIERLNARRTQPNAQIVFIKPLPGPTSNYAQDFLERVAAICYPIMRKHHLAVMSLEEYEPNPEFIGRNFNAGEVVQLVLKAPYSGHWLSFRSVVMVMMHELAHCVQMNHSGAFWKVRNSFAEEMRGLWGKGYTGEGLWGRGKTLLSGEYDTGGRVAEEVMARSLCGGTFKSVRGRKRKRGVKREKEVLSYAERQQRRIRKKFGTGGVTIGGDEEARVKLEEGKKPKGKPRVAGSARGRELRAAAALARFGSQREEGVMKKDEEEEEGESGSETDSEYEVGIKTENAVDLNGKRLVDGHGHGMVKVCEDENADDVHVKQEMQELEDINGIAPEPEASRKPIKKENEEFSRSKGIQKSREDQEVSNISGVTNSFVQTPSKPILQRASDHSGTNCPICSMDNEPSSLLCAACSHVLDASMSPGSWKCQTTTCSNSQYLNSHDCRLCGVCGTRKP